MNLKSYLKFAQKKELRIIKEKIFEYTTFIDDLCNGLWSKICRFCGSRVTCYDFGVSCLSCCVTTCFSFCASYWTYCWTWTLNWNSNWKTMTRSDVVTSYSTSVSCASYCATFWHHSMHWNHWNEISHVSPA